MTVECPNCESDEILEQVTARGIFTRPCNTPSVAEVAEVAIVSWAPVHDFYECTGCGHRWQVRV